MTTSNEQNGLNLSRRKSLQIGLRHLLVITLCSAVWIAVWINRRRANQLDAKLNDLRIVARELVIKDPTKLAVVYLDPNWFNNHRWQIYLPKTNARLCFGMRGIDSFGFPTMFQSIPLKEGRFELQLENLETDDGFRIHVTRDQELLFDVKETEWRGKSGAMTTWLINPTQQNDLLFPFVLLRERFTAQIVGSSGSTTLPNEANNGILLWIQE